MNTIGLVLLVLALYVAGVATGFFGLLFYLGRRRERRIHRRMEVPLGSVAGDGLDDVTVEAINEEQLEGMDRREAMLLIAATEAFVAELKRRFDPYEPTENEVATADIIEEDKEEWAEAMSLSHK